MPEDEEPVRITEVTLRPRIAVTGDASEERVRKLVDQAHGYCFIANSLSCRCASSRRSSAASLSAMATPDLLRSCSPPPARPATSACPRACGARPRRVRRRGDPDRLGTTVARVNGRGDHPLMAIVGHIDEIALLVSHVSDKGFLHVVQSGGWDPQVLVGQRVEVLTRDGQGAGSDGSQAPAPDRGRGAQEGRGAEGAARRHRREGRRTRRARMVRTGDQIVITAEPLELPTAGSPRARSTTAWASSWRSRWRGA